MKFLHAADLHLGKRLFEFPLLEDQSHALEKVLELIDKEGVDAVLLAGDIYQKASPQAAPPCLPALRVVTCICITPRPALPSPAVPSLTVTCWVWTKRATPSTV